MDAHSPTPWKTHLGEIVDANGVLVAGTEWGGPRKGERPTLANARHIVDCVNAADVASVPVVQAPLKGLAKRLRDEAINNAGGPVGWGRLGYDAQLDAIRARAWLIVQARAEPNRGCNVADVLSAMVDVYSRGTL